MARELTEHRSAVQFFRALLCGAVTVSTLGNVAHALLDLRGFNPIIAAPAAVVAPALLIGATWGVHKLVQAGITGIPYRVALLTTILLAAIGSVVSYITLHDLMLTQAGATWLVAILIPIGVDLSIAGSVASLLALTGVPDVLSEEPAEQEIPEQSPEQIAPQIIRASRVHPDKVAKVLHEHRLKVKPSRIARNHGMSFDTVKKIINQHEAEMVEA